MISKGVYKLTVFLVSAVVVLVLGIIYIAVNAPERPYRPPEAKTYIDLYQQCMQGRYDTSSETCKELAIKQTEKNDEQRNQKSN